MGRCYSDKSVQDDQFMWPFHIIDGGNDQIKIKLDSVNKSFSPEEISAYILRQIKKTCEDYLKKPVNDVVLSVPAYFDNKMKSATRTAGFIAGLNVKHIITEPTAAALTYGFRDLKICESKQILVYDLGGGTFDISILKICGRSYDVLAIKGDSHLGGEDFTDRMVAHFIQEFESKYKTKWEATNRLMMHRLREACEKAKRRLSDANCSETSVELDQFWVDKMSNEINFYTSITREKFEQINAHLFKKTLTLIFSCIKEAKLKIDEIDAVILVGGSTKIPFIQKFLTDNFGQERVKFSDNTIEAVAMGALLSRQR
ncbi:UNVERIFIED_CONTAM: hypothetical protein GTU68_041068 [Idotea baltica]|nr:hypothetical protein [Idotea baltica]